MAKGTLLSLVFLIVGVALLSESCEALPFELPLRLPRSSGYSHRRTLNNKLNRKSNSCASKATIIHSPPRHLKPLCQLAHASDNVFYDNYPTQPVAPTHKIKSSLRRSIFDAAPVCTMYKIHSSESKPVCSPPHSPLQYLMHDEPTPRVYESHLSPTLNSPTSPPVMPRTGVAPVCSIVQLEDSPSVPPRSSDPPHVHPTARLQISIPDYKSRDFSSDAAFQQSPSNYGSQYLDDDYEPEYFSRRSATENDFGKCYVESAESKNLPIYKKIEKRSEPSIKIMSNHNHKNRTPIVHESFGPSDERERRSENYNNERRDKVYVVYRSEAGDDGQGDNAQLDENIIRKAIEISRQQREWENALARNSQQQYLLRRYHLDQSHPNKPSSWQSEFIPVVQSPSSLPPPPPPPPSHLILSVSRPAPQPTEAVASEAISDVRMLEIRNVKFDEDVVDEKTENPVWRLNEWSTVPSAPYAKIEEQQSGIAYDKRVAPVIVSNSADMENDKLNTGEIARIKEEIKTVGSEEVTMAEGMEMPMTFTEQASFENPILSEVEVA